MKERECVDTLPLATQTGLEPATSAVTGRRANQLRYWAFPRAKRLCSSFIPSIELTIKATNITSFIFGPKDFSLVLVPPTGFEPVLPP